MRKSKRINKGTKYTGVHVHDQQSENSEEIGYTTLEIILYAERRDIYDCERESIIALRDRGVQKSGAYEVAVHMCRRINIIES